MTDDTEPQHTSDSRLPEVRRMATMFDLESEEIAARLRQAADAIEAGGCQRYLRSESGNLNDDELLHRTLLVSYVPLVENM